MSLVAGQNMVAYLVNLHTSAVAAAAGDPEDEGDTAYAKRVNLATGAALAALWLLCHVGIGLFIRLRVRHTESHTRSKADDDAPAGPAAAAAAASAADHVTFKSLPILGEDDKLYLWKWRECTRWCAEAVLKAAPATATTQQQQSSQQAASDPHPGS